MKCINCATEMTVLDSAVEIDECPQCDAHWFDHGELGALMAERGIAFDEKKLKNSLKVPSRCRWCETENPPGRVQCAMCEEPLGHNCPRDGRPMLHTAMGSLEFDYCPGCYGLWFDGDELRRLTRSMTPVKVLASASARVISVHTSARGSEDSEPDFGEPAEQDGQAQPCQVCGARVPSKELTWHASLYKCSNCFVRKAPRS